MTRRLLYLSGLAIFCTAVYHSIGWTYVGMFWWTDRYAAVTVPDFTQLGSASYYFLRTVEQIVIPAVPAFLFVAGVFAAFASGQSHGRTGWGWISRRLITLLIPYALWSLANLASLFALGERPSAVTVLRLLLVGGASSGFYFIPLLCQLYVLSPILVPLARRYWRGLLLASALLQLVAQASRYAAHLHVAVPDVLAALTPSWFFPGNVFWFAFGVVLGIHSTKLLGGIVRARWVWLAGAALLLIPGIVEWELLLRASGEAWLGSTETVLDNVYTLFFLLAFLGFEAVRLPGLSRVSALGGKAYGIYLAQGLALTLAAKTIYNVAPEVLAIPLAFALILTACGLGFPLALMEIVRHSPARRAYPYLFG